MALAKATAEAVWLRKLLFELGFPQLSPTTLYCNSQSAIALSANPKFHSRSKHVDTQYHFTREKLIANEISVSYVPTQNMTADILTNSLPKDKHIHCMEQLGMIDIPQQHLTSTKVQALMTYVRPFIPLLSHICSTQLCGRQNNLCLYCNNFDKSWSGRNTRHMDCPISKTHQNLQKDKAIDQLSPRTRQIQFNMKPLEYVKNQMVKRTIITIKHIIKPNKISNKL